MSITVATFASLTALMLFAAVFNFPPADKPEGGGGGGHFSLSEIVELSVVYLVESFLDGKSVTAGQVCKAIPEFAVYSRANSIGDAFGHGHTSPEHPNGHPDTLKMYSVKGKSPRTFRAVRENAGRAWDRCSDEQRQGIATRRGVTVADVENAIMALPPA